jgi:predicted NUDIX family NTP pyrophosphohydrolase
MPAKRSAGLLLFRRTGASIDVLLAHPGGPFWAKRDEGAWSLHKGEIDEGEDALGAARREFREETGIDAQPPFLDLGEIRQKGGKVVIGFAAEGDVDASTLASNVVGMEWPRGSGRMIEFPEVDRSEWFDVARARTKLNPAQVAFLDRLASRLD